MSRCRKISTEISVDKRVRQLPDAAALLFTWLIPHAEDDGTIPSADPDEVAAIVMPNRPGWTTEKMAECLGQISDSGLIVAWEGRLYFDHEVFYRYQTYIQEKRRRTENPWKSANSAKQRKTAQKAASHSHSHSYTTNVVTSDGEQTGAAVWVGAWVDALIESGKEAPSKRDRAIFGAKVKTIPRLDPLIMGDTIKRMVAEGKDAGLLALVYGDLKKLTERELERVMYGGGQRVR